MAGVAALLAEARAVGLTVERDGPDLLVSGSASLEPLVRQLFQHKSGVLALLRRPTTTCFDCRLTHPGPTACGGREFLVGAVIEDTPARWVRAIHCPVCCNTGP